MLNDDIFPFVGNIIVSLLMRIGVCEMHEWKPTSCRSLQLYVMLAGQLLPGNCILKLHNKILI